MSFLKRYRSLDNWGRRYWWAVGIGIALLVGQILWLSAVEHPWEGKTAERVAHGDRLGVPDYVQVYAYWAGIGVAAVIALLLATSKWWWRWTCGDVPGSALQAVRPGPKSLAAFSSCSR